MRRMVDSPKIDELKKQLDKRIFSATTLLGDLGYLLVRFPRIIGALRNREISAALREKIMLVITAINECSYCSWFHARQAVESGLSEEEIANMLKLQFQADASPFELNALLYAQHFAETNRIPDAEMTAQLFDFYGDKTAKHIILLIRMIFFGNLFGNTWAAVLNRFKGKPHEQSKVIFDCFFIVLVFWFMWIPELLTKKKGGPQ